MCKQVVLLIFIVLALRLNFLKFINALLHNLETETKPVIISMSFLSLYRFMFK
jgi:hypothetical protein